MPTETYNLLGLGRIKTKVIKYKNEYYYQMDALYNEMLRNQQLSTKRCRNKIAIQVLRARSHSLRSVDRSKIH